MTDGVTKKAKKSQLLDSGLSVKIDILVNLYIVMLKRDGVEILGFLSLLKLCFQEKLLKILYRYLYSEPTQVVKERILR
jgi:hypothetical protein